MPNHLSPAMSDVRARMQAGETFTALGVAREYPEISESTPQATFERWHAQGRIHVAGWRINTSKLAPVYAWGAGKDARRPKILHGYERTKRWRKANPDLLAGQINRAKARKLAANPPRPDRLLSALMGAAR